MIALIDINNIYKEIGILQGIAYFPSRLDKPSMNLHVYVLFNHPLAGFAYNFSSCIFCFIMWALNNLE